MRQSTRLVVFGTLTVLILWALAYRFAPSLVGRFLHLGEQGPVVEKSVSLSSPDGKWQATVESVDNGMGFGMGRLYNEVHLLPSGRVADNHGDPDPSCVFYIESEGVGKDFPTVRWVAPDRLEIEYTDLNKPGKSLPRLGAIRIDYRTRKPG